MALIPPAVLGALSLVLLRGHTSLVRGVAGFLAAVAAAPGLLVAGVPLRSGGNVYMAAIGGSAALWLILGVVASRRATQSPVASWRDFWREYLWLATGVWLGVIVALVAVDLILGRALF
jgi:hypothetical protein